MDVDDSFYDEISSFMPQPGDYSFDDLDEIIRSTDSHLDASLDLSSFTTHNVNDFDIPSVTSAEVSTSQSTSHRQEEEILQNDFQCGLSAFPSAEMSSESGSTLPYTAPTRASSASSINSDHFNPDDFMNFLNDDDMKMNELIHDTTKGGPTHNRNTPSPTGSCTSSSGSSTSGVQSDASSVISAIQVHGESKSLISNQEQEQDVKCNMSDFVKEAPDNIAIETTSESNLIESKDPLKDHHFVLPTAPTTTMVTTATTAATVIPITLPVMPLPTIQPVQSVNVLQGTLIPVQTVPLTTVAPVKSINVAPAVKIDTKVVPKAIKAQPVKIISTAPSSTTPGSATSKTKVFPPVNAKPKTIFLSSNDFKALMQKMNSNGAKKVTNSNVGGQVPKIIMKTANGKVITANKIATTTNAAQAAQFVPKILKATGPLVIKQHPTKITTTSARSPAVAAARATLSHYKGSGAGGDLSIYKGLIDEKILKKQQRMLKNRESASLSRKKKKEYVVSLETRISNLEKENYTLKGENTSLRSQLVALAQTCKCKHGNVSEFILNSLNANSRVGETIFSNCNVLATETNHVNTLSSHTNSSYGSTTHHVKIAPKPSPKSLKQRMNATAIKKNVAVLFAMAFMVTLNVGNFQNYLHKNSLETAMEAAVAEEPIAAGRRLMWVQNESEFNAKHNRSKREAELSDVPPPPLHFLRPVNRTAGGEASKPQQQQHNGTVSDEPPIRVGTKCRSSAMGNSSNFTENMRLASDLHKWIGGNDYLNLTPGNEFDRKLRFKLSSDYMDLQTLDLPLQTGMGGQQKRKLYMDEIQNKQRKLEVDVDSDNGQSLELFKPKISEEYVRLFKGIKRQDDTFYVLSFNMDHILLPASAYNKSARPKMSLMLPARDPALNGDVVLMQIDCEVMNTTELQLKSHMIPEKLRRPKYGNVNVNLKPNGVADNKAEEDSSKEHQKLQPKDAGSKERQLPRTYFMMGPQTKAATTSGAADLKRKSGIVKFNASDSIIGSGVLNVYNSSLFAKMRDTVVAGNSNLASLTHNLK